MMHMFKYGRPCYKPMGIGMQNIEGIRICVRMRHRTKAQRRTGRIYNIIIDTKKVKNKQN